MISRKTSLVVLAVLVLAAAASWAATINVPADQPTIQAAVNAAANGDTILVAAGPYPEQITINKNNLLIRSVSGAAVTIIRPASTAAPGGIYITGDGNTLDGFTVEDFTDDTYENKIIRIHNGADNNVIVNNVIRGNFGQPGIADQTEYGILIYGNGNHISGNEIYDIGYTAINVVGPPHSGASGNVIFGNQIHHIGIYGITFDRSPNTSHDNVMWDFVGGILWGEDYDPVQWCWAFVVWGEAADGSIIRNNDLSGVGLYNGIVLSSAHNSLVRNNDIAVSSIGVKIAVSSWAGGVPVGNMVFDNDIKNGTEGVRFADYGSTPIGADNVVRCNRIEGNSSFGVNNLSTVGIMATCNWWGVAAGPGPVGPGTGDQVTANVTYDPWLTSDVCLDEDSDLVVDNCDDNCPSVYNPGQEDTDGDGFGDVCDINNMGFSFRARSDDMARELDQPCFYFGWYCVGDEACGDLIISNNSPVDVLIVQACTECVDRTVSECGYFDIQAPSPRDEMLEAGEQATITFCFDPYEISPEQAEFRWYRCWDAAVSYQVAGDPRVQEGRVYLEGKVSEQGCFLGKVAPDQDFGQVIVGAVREQVVNLTNTGCTPLTVHELVSDHPAFTVVTAMPVVIGAESGQDVLVRFAPSATGDVAGVLTVKSDAQNRDQDGVLFGDVTVALKGVGLSATSGDVNQDGVVNVLDVIQLVNVVLGIAPQSNVADINADGMVNILDALGLANIIVNQ